MKEIIKIGNVLTDEVMSTLANAELNDEQAGQFIRGILFGRKALGGGIVSILVDAMRADHLQLQLSCARTKMKELERLRKFYSAKGKDAPEWFAKYYAVNSKHLSEQIRRYESEAVSPNNVIGSFTNVSNKDTNVSVMLGNGSVMLDNVSQTFAIDTNTNTKTNSKTNPNPNDTEIEIVPPISPKGDEESSSSSSEPPSILDDPALCLSGAVQAAKNRELAEDPEVEKAERERLAGEIATEIETVYPYHGNPQRLRKCLSSILKKNAAAEIRKGFDLWMEHWAKEEYRYAPRKIRDWLYELKFLEAPVGYVKEARRIEEVQGSSSELA